VEVEAAVEDKKKIFLSLKRIKRSDDISDSFGSTLVSIDTTKESKIRNRIVGKIVKQVAQRHKIKNNQGLKSASA
jgi:hypothetical protein